MVIDYKTGKSAKYETFPRCDGASDAGTDLTERGTKLQLPLYALAARQAYGGAATPVSAYYWFVDEKDARLGGSVGQPAVNRFHEVLGVLTEGIGDGAFPARPGHSTPSTDRSRAVPGARSTGFCSNARDDEWAQIRDDTRVSRYAGLAEPAGSSG